MQALEVLVAMDAVEWKWLAKVRDGEWCAACPVCSHWSLLVREPERDAAVEFVCGRGCDRERVREMIEGFAWFDSARNPAPKPRRKHVSFPVRDGLDEIPASEYVPQLSGREVVRGFACCPFHDGDRNGSLRAYDTAERGFYCWGCHVGGRIVDFGAALYGITPRGRGFHEIKERLRDDLGVAA